MRLEHKPYQVTLVTIGKHENIDSAIQTPWQMISGCHEICIKNGNYASIVMIIFDNVICVFSLYDHYDNEFD